MGIVVLEASHALIALRAALEPNLNHRSTAFGGSVASLAVLAGWSLLRIGFDNVAPTPQIVIQRSAMEYLAPIAGPFEARCARPRDEDWQRFLSTFTRRGRARLELDVDVHCDGAPAARLRGGFVAVRDA